MTKNSKYTKKELLLLIYIVLFQSIFFFILDYFLSQPLSYRKYIYQENPLENNNKWITILNLGICETFKTNIKGFPSINCLKFLILIYYGVFVSWFLITPFLAYKYIDKNRIRLLLKTYLIILLISFLIFLIFPIQALKEFQLEVDGESKSFFDPFIAKLYKLDNRRFCSLPSLHVALSWLCYIAFRFQSDNKIIKKIMLIQLLIAILVFISTFVLKQHYIMDGVISIILVEIVLYFVFGKNQKIKKIY